MSKLMVLAGIPASGKSTHAQILADEHNAVIHSTDAIREELYGDATIQAEHIFIFATAFRRIFRDLARGANVIFDATNINASRRSEFLESVSRIHEAVCYVIRPSLDDCLTRNACRDRVVPEEVIRNMDEHFQTPTFDEGWDDIIVLAV